MIADCPGCNGTGEVLYLPKGRYSPEDVIGFRCGFCGGTGDVDACAECREILAYCECGVSVYLPVPAGFESEDDSLPF